MVEGTNESKIMNKKLAKKLRALAKEKQISYKELKKAIKHEQRYGAQR